jgi:WD40 repeat protein
VEVYGSRLFSASADKTIRVWDIDSRRCEHVLEDHTRPVLSLAISGNRLYSGSYDFTIKVCTRTCSRRSCDSRSRAAGQHMQQRVSVAAATRLQCLLFMVVLALSVELPCATAAAGELRRRFRMLL